MSPRPSEHEIVESAITAIEGILRLSILQQHKRALISGTIWLITEARGKYTTRFRSRRSLDEPDAKLHHEHVFTRKDLTARIMERPEEARTILSDAIACVVTRDEHRLLAQAERSDRSLRGWKRYEAVGIEVVDMDASSSIQPRSR